MTEQVVDTREEWGVELPDGTECECRDQDDADAIVQAAKTVSPRAKYKPMVRTVYVGEWKYVA